MIDYLLLIWFFVGIFCLGFYCGYRVRKRKIDNEQEDDNSRLSCDYCINRNCVSNNSICSICFDHNKFEFDEELADGRYSIKD